MVWVRAVDVAKTAAVVSAAVVSARSPGPLTQGGASAFGPGDPVGQPESPRPPVPETVCAVPSPLPSFSPQVTYAVEDREAPYLKEEVERFVRDIYGRKAG